MRKTTQTVGWSSWIMKMNYNRHDESSSCLGDDGVPVVLLCEHVHERPGLQLRDVPQLAVLAEEILLRMRGISVSDVKGMVNRDWQFLWNPGQNFVRTLVSKLMTDLLLWYLSVNFLPASTKLLVNSKVFLWNFLNLTKYQSHDRL